MNHEQLLNELFKFIKLIPDDILSECIERIEYPNRTERRKYDKYKSADSKIQAFLQNMTFRVQLIENLYNRYSDGTDSEVLSYDDILSSINSTNCISQTLFMLHRCCDNEFDKKHFSDFIQSTPFLKTINNEWEEEHTDIPPALENTYEEKSKMKYYLGQIEIKNYYYNFIPQYTLEAKDKNITVISSDELSQKFPTEKKLNLAASYPVHKAFLKKLDVNNADNNYNSKTIYKVSFSDDEIEDNDNTFIRKKLDLQKICENEEELSNRIKSISEDDNLFLIVTPKDNITNESFAGMIFINEKDYPANEKVLLEYGNDRKLFGPFTLQERPIDGEKYVRPDIATTKYYLEYYSENDYELLSFENNTYWQKSVYTDIAYIKNEPHYYDVISDSILLTKLNDSIDTNLLSSNPEEFTRLYSASPFLENIPDEIRNGRISRIQEILKNTTDYDDLKKKALNTLVDSLDDELLVSKIQNSDLYKDLQSKYTDLQEYSKTLSNNNNALEEEKNNLSQEIESLKAEQTSIDTKSMDSTKIEELESEIQSLKEKLSLVKKVEELSTQKEVLDNEISRQSVVYDNKVKEVDRKEAELQTIKNEIETAISDALKADTTNMIRTAFDPYISNAMIEAAGKYRIDEEANQYKNISDEMSSIASKCQEIDKNTLIDTLVEGVRQFRAYSKNDILNMYICLSQSFLTVFSGEPGTGKTSICNILADSLGLNKFGSTGNISKNRYVPVSVERGWSSKRDLIGYFNPLTQKYDRSNAKIYDGLMILNEEKKESRFPYLILLDEANLSPMEYYWADFMRAADSSESDVFINIGTEEDIYIPKTLHFLATINNDQTTEQLSPRLIDRAWIVKLPTNCGIKESTKTVDECFKNSVLWEDIEKTFVSSESNEMSLKKVAEDIYELFNVHHLTVSPRVQQSIKNYVCVAQEIMEDEFGVTKKQKAMDFAIVQKLLPKINGYYKNYERLFTSLTQICDENGLKMTKEALTSMAEMQEQNMGYCQYLV